MTVNDLLQQLSQDSVETWVRNSWIVPVSMIALYFYGRSHFNQPGYPVESIIRPDAASSDSVRLITPAPPIFTTRRGRYNLYAHWYILILEISFLAIILLYNVIPDIGRVLSTKLPSLQGETLQFRAILALFALTGLLSSFPGFKDIDVWLLGKLHRAAFIPDDARFLAEKLCNSVFIPPRAVKETVGAGLSMRDTRRVAEGNASGTLEKKIFDLLCLRAQVHTALGKEKSRRVKLMLERDMKTTSFQMQELRADTIAYLRDQERIVPATEREIDTWIASNVDGNSNVAGLSARRRKLRIRCDALFDTMCLVIALSLFATEALPDDIDAALGEMGFETTVPKLPILDWDAVALIVSASSVLLLAFNMLFTSFTFIFKPQQDTGILPVFDKPMILRFVVLFTLIYGIIMLLSIKLKRRWRRSARRGAPRPENLLIALYSYILTVPINVVLSLYIHKGELTTAPFLFALNQAVLGYFIGMYIDRSLGTPKISYKLPLAQGILQAVGSLAAVFLSQSMTTNPKFNAFLIIFSTLQASASGVFVGVLFQYLYKQSNNSPADVSRDRGSPEELRSAVIAQPLPER